MVRTFCSHGCAAHPDHFGTQVDVYAAQLDGFPRTAAHTSWRRVTISRSRASRLSARPVPRPMTGLILWTRLARAGAGDAARVGVDDLVVDRAGP